MEGNYLTSGDLAMWDTARTSRAGNFYGDGYGHGYHRNGTATTGVALGAAGLGIAIFGGIAIAAGLNAASKARARGAENTMAAQSKTMDVLTQVLLTERNSRESWQNNHAPTISQYVDVQAQSGAGAGAGANALATAEALALLNNGNSGVNSAIGGCNYLRVARVSGSRLCGCDGCGEG